MNVTSHQVGRKVWHPAGTPQAEATAPHTLPPDPTYIAEVLFRDLVPQPQSSDCGRHLIAPQVGPDRDPARVAADALPPHTWSELAHG